MSLKVDKSLRLRETSGVQEVFAGSSPEAVTRVLDSSVDMGRNDSRSRIGRWFRRVALASYISFAALSQAGCVNEGDDKGAYEDDAFSVDSGAGDLKSIENEPISADPYIESYSVTPGHWLVAVVVTEKPITAILYYMGEDDGQIGGVEKVELVPDESNRAILQKDAVPNGFRYAEILLEGKNEVYKLD